MKNEKIDFEKASSEIKEKIVPLAEKTKSSIQKGASVVKDSSVVAYQKAIDAIDANGNGEIDIEDIILNAMKVPGIRIDRDKFLAKELQNVCDQDTIDIAIAKNPMSANIDLDIIDKLAEDTIKFERNCVSGISAALGIPGGVAMVATVPADILQYYGYMIRTAQKLMYLYGFPAISTDSKETKLDTATINTLTICLGVMYGVVGANNAIKAMAKSLGEGVSKQLMKKALTKGTIYPIVKSVSKWFNVKMTKEIFTGFFKKSIPVVGGVVGAGITYVSFKPCCEKLKNTLKDTALSNPNYVHDSENDIIIEISEEDVVEVD